MKIHFIYSDGCKECKKMRKVITECLYNHELIEINSESDEAIDFAVANNITDIPACFMEGKLTQGSKFDEQLIRQTLCQK